MAKLPVDFSKADEGGGTIRVPEGDYRAKVTEIKVGTSKAGNTMLIWTFTLTEGKHKGKKLRDWTTLNVEAAWKLKGLLEALGIKVPAKKLDVTPLIKKAKGKELGLTLTDEEYEKKMSSKVSSCLDLETLEDIEDEEDEDEDEDEEDEDGDEEEEDEEEEPTRKKKKAKKKKPADDDDEDIEDLDIDEI